MITTEVRGQRRPQSLQVPRHRGIGKSLRRSNEISYPRCERTKARGVGEEEVREARNDVILCCEIHIVEFFVRCAFFFCGVFAQIGSCTLVVWEVFV